MAEPKTTPADFPEYVHITNLYKWFEMVRVDNCTIYELGKAWKSGKNNETTRYNPISNTRHTQDDISARSWIVDICQANSGYLVLKAFRPGEDVEAHTAVVQCPNIATGYLLGYRHLYNGMANDSTSAKAKAEAKEQDQQHQHQHYQHQHQAPGNVPPQPSIQDRLLEQALPYIPGLMGALTQAIIKPVTIGKPQNTMHHQAPPAPGQTPGQTPGTSTQPGTDTERILALVAQWDNLDQDNNVDELIQGIIYLKQNNPGTYTMAVGFIKSAAQNA